MGHWAGLKEKAFIQTVVKVLPFGKTEGRERCCKVCSVPAASQLLFFLSDLLRVFFLLSRSVAPKQTKQNCLTCVS